jgi:hypothetical protein
VLSVPGPPDLWTVVALVDDAARDAVERVRRRGAAWWRGAVTGGASGAASRADTVADLVRHYAVAGHALEVGAGPAPEAYRVPRRPARDPVLADQLAVVAADAVAALRAAGPGAPARYPDGVRTAEAVAAVLLAETLLHGYDVDPGPLDEDAAAAAVAALHPNGASAGDVATFGDLLLRLERGPGMRQRELR